MVIKAIEVMGNLLILENVSVVSEIFDYYKDGKFSFTLSYAKGDKYIMFSPAYPELKKTMTDTGNLIIMWTDKPLQELRDLIISIIMTPNVN